MRWNSMKAAFQEFHDKGAVEVDDALHRSNQRESQEESLNSAVRNWVRSTSNMITQYSFIDSEGSEPSFTTQDPLQALHFAETGKMQVIENKYTFDDSEPVAEWDFRTKGEGDADEAAGEGVEDV